MRRKDSRLLGVLWCSTVWARGAIWGGGMRWGLSVKWEWEWGSAEVRVSVVWSPGFAFRPWLCHSVAL